MQTYVLSTTALPEPKCLHTKSNIGLLFHMRTKYCHNTQMLITHTEVPTASSLQLLKKRRKKKHPISSYWILVFWIPRFDIVKMDCSLPLFQQYNASLQEQTPNWEHNLSSLSLRTADCFWGYKKTKRILTEMGIDERRTTWKIAGFVQHLPSFHKVKYWLFHMWGREFFHDETFCRQGLWHSPNI